METKRFIKPVKAVVLVVAMMLVIAVSLSGNFGDVLRLNEVQTSPNLPSAYFNSSSSVLIKDGHIYGVYGIQTPQGQPLKTLFYVRYYEENGETNIQRVPLKNYTISKFNPATAIPEPMIAMIPRHAESQPHNQMIVVYPEFHDSPEYGIFNSSLRRLIIDREGNVLENDRLFTNVYLTDNLITDDSKINLLFKEGLPGVNLDNNHRFSDTFETLDGVPGNVWFFAGDVVYGRVHSNTDIWIRANSWPIFYGLVSTGGTITVSPGGGSNYPGEQIFRGGLIENYSSVYLPETAVDARRFGVWPLGRTPRYDMIAYITVEGEHYEILLGEIVTEDVDDPDFRWIEGHNQFTVYNSYPPYGAIGDSVSVNRIPKVDTLWETGPTGALTNSSAFIPMQMWISGNFAGKQTWASSHDVYLKGDLTYYNTVPRLPPDGGLNNQHPVNQTDYLGIVSERNIYIQYGHFHPIDSVRVKPNTNNIYMYGSYYALGQGRIGRVWEDGVITPQYQFPKGATPNQYYLGSRYKNIDLHRFRYPTSFQHPWPPGLDYPWYNPLWPEPGNIYGFQGIPHTPNPHNAPEIVKMRGNLRLFGSMITRRVGYVQRSGNRDFDTGIWDINNVISPNTPPQYGAPEPSIGPSGYNKDYYYDHRLDHTSPPHTPKGNDVSIRRFHYRTSVDGKEFTPVMSKYFDDYSKTLLMAAHQSSVAILADRTLYLFPDNAAEYEETVIPIPAQETVREMIFTEHGLYLLTTYFIEVEEAYLSILYRFDIQNDSLVEIDEKLLPNMIQTIHHFKDQVLWAAVVDDETVNINRYNFYGISEDLVSWQHNIELPPRVSKDLSTLSLKSEDDLLAITLSFRELRSSRTPNSPFDIPDEYAFDYGGNAYTASGYFEFTAIEEKEETPLSPPFSLAHFPNPLRRSELAAGKMMNIDFALPGRSNVKIDIYNIRGQHIKSLADDEFQTGTHSVYWDGTDKNKGQVPSGVFFYQFKTDDKVNSRKLIIIR